MRNLQKYTQFFFAKLTKGTFIFQIRLSAFYWFPLYVLIIISKRANIFLSSFFCITFYVKWVCELLTTTLSCLSAYASHVLFFIWPEDFFPRPCRRLSQAALRGAGRCLDLGVVSIYQHGTGTTLKAFGQQHIVKETFEGHHSLVGT